MEKPATRPPAPSPIRSEQMKKSRFRNHDFQIVITKGNWNTVFYEPQYRIKRSFIYWSWYTPWYSIDGYYYETMEEAKQAVEEFVLPEKGQLLAFLPVDINAVKSES